MFKALVVNKENGQHSCTYTRWNEDQLPAKAVLVDVHYSSLNFKDGLAVTGKGKILRDYPMIPGIDLAGTVLESADDQYQVGDEVVLTGAGLGEDYCGGFAERARVDAAPLIRPPSGMSLYDCMVVGTAGFTAMLAVAALQKAEVTPDMGPILVTGAAGGVGSVAIAILARLGYQVTALTGRASTHSYLTQLGATEIIGRAEMQEPARPLENQRWAGAIDNVGGPILSKVIAQTMGNGAIASCGLAASHELNSTVMPFILRAVKLLGINSTLVTPEHRQAMWTQLSTLFDSAFWQSISQSVAFAELPHYAEQITLGEVRGRLVVKIKE